MDDTPSRLPTALPALRSEARDAGFVMSSEDRTGSLLAALSAARPAGRILELGTGAGAGTAWLLSGMDSASRPTTVDLIDDLLPQPGRPEGHEASGDRLLAELDAREDFRCVRLAWAGGLLMAVRTV